jgi:hypothetical protein
MIWTSHFGSKAPSARKVCIAKRCPAGFIGFHASSFAPSNPWAKGDWRARYLAELRERFPTGESLLAELRRIEARLPDPILCCYEADPSLCHRRVLAGYALELAGLEIAEWGEQRILL